VRLYKLSVQMFISLRISLIVEILELKILRGEDKGQGVEVAQAMYTHMNKCKNNKKKMGMPPWTSHIIEVFHFCFTHHKCTHPCTSCQNCTRSLMQPPSHCGFENSEQIHQTNCSYPLTLETYVNEYWIFYYDSELYVIHSLCK
jgi:hypothetical protein